MARSPETASTREEKSSLELPVKHVEVDMTYEEWKNILKRFPIPASVLAGYPVDIWQDLPDPPSARRRTNIAYDTFPPDAIKEDRFDLIYNGFVQRGKTFASVIKESGVVLFEKEGLIREKLANLITQGRFRLATYLLRSVELFYPNLNISPAEFSDFLPQYPALMVSYKNMEKVMELEKEECEPMQDLFMFYLKESLLGEVQRVRHEIEMIASSPTLSDEAKDGALRSLRMKVADMSRPLESDIDAAADRLARQFLGALTVRRNRMDLMDVNLRAFLWRDEEDAMNALKRIRTGLSIASSSRDRWGTAAQEVFDFFTLKLRPRPASKEEMRMSADHLFDLMHNSGSMFGWMGGGKGRFESNVLNHFPIVFLEFRKYNLSEHPAQDMLVFANEWKKLINYKEGGTRELLDIYCRVLARGKEPTGELAEFIAAFPMLFSVISHMPAPTTYVLAIDRALHSSRTAPTNEKIQAILPDAFLENLQQTMDAHTAKLADIRAKLERMKSTYGYRAS